MRDQSNLETIDIGPLIEELTDKIHRLSYQHASLLDKINDLYIRLEITSTVIEESLISLGMSRDSFTEIAKNKAKEVVDRLTTKSLQKIQDLGSDTVS